MNRAVIVGIDSGLGALIADDLQIKGWEVLGTSRRELLKESSHSKRFKVSFCDFLVNSSIDSCAAEIINENADWQILILAIGILDPIGPFETIDFEKWEDSYRVNFLGQMRFIQQMLKPRSETTNRLVLTFAGGGTNTATLNFSSYTLAKISLIKAMELLAAEIQDTKFVSLGTGWMDTPIHHQTLAAENNAGSAYLDTLERIESGNFGKAADLLDFIDWCWSEDKVLVSGRNFSLQGDPWRESQLNENLKTDINMFKLRRFKNHVATKDIS